MYKMQSSLKKRMIALDKTSKQYTFNYVCLQQAPETVDPEGSLKGRSDT